MVKWDNEFQHDTGEWRKPPGRALRPLNEPLSDTNNTLVQTDRGVFVCSSPLTQIAAAHPGRNHVNHVNPVQHKGSVRHESPRHGRPNTVQRRRNPKSDLWCLAIRTGYVSTGMPGCLLKNRLGLASATPAGVDRVEGSCFQGYCVLPHAATPGYPLSSLRDGLCSQIDPEGVLEPSLRQCHPQVLGGFLCEGFTCWRRSVAPGRPRRRRARRGPCATSSEPSSETANTRPTAACSRGRRAMNASCSAGINGTANPSCTTRPSKPAGPRATRRP